ncbi:MAG: hypothetical protein IJE07_09270 [Clostridia bacterium]|nr:hypothetical protein [Clostridia bacterium]
MLNLRKMPAFCLAMLMLIALAVTQWLLPAQEISEMENRVLAQKPTLTPDRFWSGAYATELEQFAADQMPLRDGFVSTYATMQAILGRRTSNDALRGKDGFLFDTSAVYTQRNLSQNTDALRGLAEQSGKQLWVLAVPTAAAVYAEKTPAYAPLGDDEASLAAVAQEVQLIPLLDAMRAREDQQLYYTMDHHWTAAGARVGYEAVCSALGLEVQPEGNIVSREGFYGSFYARYPLPWLKADVLTYEAPEGVRLLIDGVEQDTLADEAALQGRDKYAALLHGNHGCIELINDGVDSGVLLVIKDSYANALLPLLARNYHRIIAVDPRYFTGDIIALATQYEGEDILCVCGIGTLASSRIIALMEGF